MLSNESRPYIDASVPVLRQHGLAITRHFYHSMFQAHPELRNLFNMGNQAIGTQPQSLAAAVFAYAAHYDNPNALAPVLERIVHKHASVGVKAEHYPIVGHHLINAIHAILGEAATPQLLNAWREAYGELSNALIQAEKTLYEHAGVFAGQLNELLVLDVHQENENVKSYRLQTRDGQSPGPFKPGQYVSVAVTIDGLRQLRQYSLSDAPERPWWRICVKREAARDAHPEGKISNWLHEHIQPNHILPVSAAFGDFTPTIEASTPMALLSAGVGITPMISILNALIERNSTRPILFSHALHDRNQHLLYNDVIAARSRLTEMTEFLFYERESGRMNLSALDQSRFLETDFYVCGPAEFMRQQWSALIEAGVSPTRIHREVFGSELLEHLISPIE